MLKKKNYMKRDLDKGKKKRKQINSNIHINNQSKILMIYLDLKKRILKNNNILRIYNNQNNEDIKFIINI